MRAVLILFMVDAISKGGLGLDDRTANAVYGLYGGATYLLSLFGGWIADRLIGQQRAVFAGGVLIVLGNSLLAVGRPTVFFVGLIVIVLGVGLLKPNVSAIVAQLYPEGGARRDAGFSIFYMGINLGASVGSWLVPSVAAAYGWATGFALPAGGMALGLVWFAGPVTISARPERPRRGSGRAGGPLRCFWRSSCWSSCSRSQTFSHSIRSPSQSALTGP